jgi:DNA-binding transcriptional LysR family regulator
MALRMFGGLLDRRKWDVDILPASTLAAELLLRVREDRPGAVVIAALPPGGLAHTRYLCKRLRQRFPELKIAVGLCGAREDPTEVGQDLAAVGADHVAVKLLETREALDGWAPVLAVRTEPPTPVSSSR